MRRNYQYSEPEKTKIDVGETHVTVRERSGRVLVARILEKLTDTNGRVVSILLDRIVHERYGMIEGWKANGCFVTELTTD